MADHPSIPPTLPPVQLPSAASLIPVMASWSPRASMVPDDFELPKLSLPPTAYGTELSLDLESLAPPAKTKPTTAGIYAFVRSPGPARED